jgi:hypothetical protein
MDKILGDEPSFYDAKWKFDANSHSPQHSTYMEIKNFIPPDYEIIAVTRDPYDRYLSEYCWRIHHNFINKTMSQDEFAKVFFESNQHWDNHEKSQEYFLHGGMDKIKLIKLVDLDKFLKTRFGIEAPIKNNVNKNSDIKISKYSKKMVEKFWAADFKISKM